MLVHHYLEYYARNTPDLACITQGDATMSYGELDAAANRLAHGFLDLGVERGQRVAVLGENSIEHCVLFMAASKVGAVAVPLNYRLAPAELAFIIEDANTKALLILDGMESLLAALRERLPADTAVITRDQPDTQWFDISGRGCAHRSAGNLSADERHRYCLPSPAVRRRRVQATDRCDKVYGKLP